MHVNKVHSVKTIDRVAKELGESVDWLHEVADEMDTEDGVIWVYGDTDDGVMAFTDFGIETLSISSKCTRKTPRSWSAAPLGNRHPAAYPGWLRFKVLPRRWVVERTFACSTAAAACARISRI